MLSKRAEIDVLKEREKYRNMHRIVKLKVDI
jgi:hypothetical protein